MKLTPYQRIMRAAEKGKGLRLSADEVIALSMDDAIMTRAELDDDRQITERIKRMTKLQ